MYIMFKKLITNSTGDQFIFPSSTNCRRKNPTQYDIK